MAELSGKQIAQLQDAILGAFTPDDLRQFLLTRLDKYLPEISLGPNLKIVVLDVITEAEREGWTDDLLDAVANERPNRSDLLALCNRLRSGRQRLSEIPCPYRGLEYFDVPHAANYFGRTAMVEKLVEKLKRANFVAVVGPSGCGKSSLVRAGLLPALNGGALPGSAAWQVEIFRPSDDPLRALATALVNRLAPDLSPVDRLAEARKLADGLRSGALPVGDVLAQLRAQSPDAPRLLLIADQFEEAFTLCTDDEARRAFLDALLAIAEAPWVTVLFTLRADFYGRVLETERFGKRVDAGLVNVLPMSREERREAVEQPALRAGCRFEEGLVERILDAVEDAPGDLPLLEFALTELWARQTADGALTHEAYEEIGEVRGAIARRADEAMAGLDAEQQAAVRAIFTRLVQVARPDETGQDARRRVDLDELPPESQALAQRLADARLLVTGRDPISGDETIEVAHEALIRGWGQLQEWLNRDREFLLWRQRLRTLADIWEESGRNEGALLRDALLREAQVRSEGREGDLSALERAFIAESGAAAARAEQEEAAARQRELEQVQALAESRARAEEQARSARRLQILAWALSVLLAVAVVTSATSFWFFRSAKQSAQLAQSRMDQMRVLLGADVAADAETRAQVALLLAETATELAAGRKVEEATDAFARAVALDPAYHFIAAFDLAENPEAKEQVVLLLARTAARQAQAGKTMEARDALARAVALDPAYAFLAQVAEEPGVGGWIAYLLARNAAEQVSAGQAVEATDGFARAALADPTYAFVNVPAGEFTMGSADSDPNANEDEKPQERVGVGNFWIMRTEVTNAQYTRCVAAGACTSPANTRWDQPEYAGHPVTNVDWSQANAYARWAGGRLPTEAEWEKACRGTDGRIYPWGDAWDPSKANTREGGVGDTTPVGSYSEKSGDSPYGAADMAGNVWEWTSTLFRTSKYDANDGREDMTATGNRVLRGGSFNHRKADARCASRSDLDPSFRSSVNDGFRVGVSPGL